MIDHFLLQTFQFWVSLIYFENPYLVKILFVRDLNIFITRTVFPWKWSKKHLDVETQFFSNLFFRIVLCSQPTPVQLIAILIMHPCRNSSENFSWILAYQCFQLLYGLWKLQKLKKRAQKIRLKLQIDVPSTYIYIFKCSFLMSWEHWFWPPSPQFEFQTDPHWRGRQIMLMGILWVLQSIGP